jgi:hypothetical protein
MARVTAWVRPASVSRFLLREAAQSAASATKGNRLLGVDGRFVVLSTYGRCNTTWEVSE